MVQVFMYKQIEFNKNTLLDQFIDLLTIKTEHEITEIPNDQNWVITFRLWS